MTDTAVVTAETTGADTTAVVATTTPAVPLVSRTEETTTETTTQPTWPDDWRQKWAKSDEKKAKHLERYASPEAAFDALVAAKQKISEGGLKKTLPDNPTEDQLKEWRQENGIPDAPDKYKLELGDGRLVGEQEKPILSEFLKRMHSQHMPEKQVNEAVKAYYEIQDEQIRQQETKDLEFEQQAEDKLRAEFGGDYRRNLNLAMNMLSTASSEARDKILGARTAEGHALGSDPDVIRYLVQLAREVNPLPTLAPGAQGNVATAIADELAGYQKMMGDPNSDYWKGPKSAQIQARTRELIEGQEQIKRRA